MIPLDLLFQSNTYQEGSSGERVLRLSYRGKDVLVRQVKDTLVIDRLVSTDPQDYLDPALQPGQVVGYIPVSLKPPQ
ncbi:MAG TPA: hypothetical protein GXX40_04770 [Firmicutes bacterium]|nr:hypothetical protein [Bacillota bacterium]